jgi:hypothetical protein
MAGTVGLVRFGGRGDWERGDILEEVGDGSIEAEG